MSSATTAAQREIKPQPFTVVGSSFDTPLDKVQSEKPNLFRDGVSKAADEYVHRFSRIKADFHR